MGEEVKLCSTIKQFKTKYRAHALIEYRNEVWVLFFYYCVINCIDIVLIITIVNANSGTGKCNHLSSLKEAGK